MSQHSSADRKAAEYLKAENRSRMPAFYGAIFVAFLGLLAYQTDIVTMWWRNTFSGTAILFSSTIFSSLFTTVIHLPATYGSYVDPAVLNACPGYVTRGVTTTRGGGEVRIDLGLPSNRTGCSVFGKDIERLTVVVTYETDTRLHIKIVNAASSRYEVPESVFPRPKSSFVSPGNSKLRFQYTSAPRPFSLTVSRASTNEVLFSTTGHQLIYEEQYLRLKTSLPQGSNIYGLGEHSETFRLDTNNGGNGTTRTLWSRDSFGIPTDSNLYGNHPVYFDHRTTGTHGVLLLNSNGMDIKLNETEGQKTLEYNVIGGILDLYFLAGSESDPAVVAQQYAELSGLAAEVPYWSFGFHQCRFGYKDYIDVAGVISKYRAAGIPLETMWTDIDYMDDRLIFTVDPQYFPLNRLREIVAYLHKNNQHYILMTDPAVGYLPNKGYAAFDHGKELDIWLKNPNGTDFLGLVWPGVTVYPDWFHPRVGEYWDSQFQSFYNPETGVDIDGVWIDMNEPASFCEFPCVDPFGEAVVQNLPPPRTNAPPDPNAAIFTGAEANSTVTPRASFESSHDSTLARRQEDQSTLVANDSLLLPPYNIANAAGALSSRTAYTNIVHANNLTEYDTHNLYGSMMSTATRHAMLARRPNRRPLIITRSTFAGAGKDVGKWLGDNLSTWAHYRSSIAGMLNFASIFNVPMVGSDTCGFGDNTTETLCARWATLGAFNPFYRNHNIDSGISQEFYVWPLTTQAAKNAIDIRYRLLDYIYTAFHVAHTQGTPILSPLWYKYPKDTTTFPIDLQFFYGPSVLVSPVTDENSTTVKFYLPRDTWYDFSTLSSQPSTGTWVTRNNVAYSDIPLHIKGGSVLALRSESAMTTTELRTKPFNIVVAPNGQGKASGQLYVDDGETIDPAQSKTTLVDFEYSNNKLVVSGRFGYNAGVGWKTVKIAGVSTKPARVLVDGSAVSGGKVRYDAQAKVVEVDVGVATLKKFDVVLA